MKALVILRDAQSSGPLLHAYTCSTFSGVSECKIFAQVGWTRTVLFEVALCWFSRNQTEIITGMCLEVYFFSNI